MINMTCAKCGKSLSAGDEFAGTAAKCPCGADLVFPTPGDPLAQLQNVMSGAPGQPPYHPGMYGATSAAAIAAQKDASGRLFAILGIIFGCISLAILPILFGPAGIIMGVIATSKMHNKGLGIASLVIAIFGMIMGFIIGAMVYAGMHHR